MDIFSLVSHFIHFVLLHCHKVFNSFESGLKHGIKLKEKLSDDLKYENQHFYYNIYMYIFFFVCLSVKSIDLVSWLLLSKKRTRSSFHG